MSNGEIKQYCRYCSYADDIVGDKISFMCFAPDDCGDDGNGEMHDASKAKRQNHCKHFDFHEEDIFGNGVYKPRSSACAKKEVFEQLLLFETLQLKKGDCCDIIIDIE